ncbi:MAG: MarR family transcriptional regulator [Patescibacteria group bacterium]
MPKPKKDLKILGLEDKEKVIIQTLKDFGQLRPIDLAKKTGVKRTTVNFLLKKLLRQGLISKVKIKGHYEWLINNDKIKKLIGNLYSYFNTADIAEIIQLPPDIGVEVSRGKKNILLAYERILEAGYNSRVFAIEGNKSAAASQELGKSYFSNIQNKFREYKIILEGVFGEEALLSFNDLSIESLKIYKNRLVIAYVAPNFLMDFDLDILIFKKMVIMINFEKKLVLTIKNQEIYTVILNLFEALKMVSRKIDLNDYIKQLIDKK